MDSRAAAYTANRVGFSADLQWTSSGHKWLATDGPTASKGTNTRPSEGGWPPKDHRSGHRWATGGPQYHSYLGQQRRTL